ncbi:MAG TPA: 3-oxoacyl-ACP reductase [Solirubrobacteraceae bacterium]|nr:3-oxoacyl-ACP reductase [Solirubrobacteraceae bacterium]
MSDRYAQVVNSLPGRLVAGRVGLPRPAKLKRYKDGDPAIAGPALVGAAPGGTLAEQVERVLAEAGCATAQAADGDRSDGAGKVAALLFDAGGIADSTQLVELQRFFHPNVRRVQASGRVVVLGTPPAGLDPRRATAQRALEGFTRSLGKEIGRGVAVQLVYVREGAGDQLDSTLRFLLSPRSAYVSGQVIHVGSPVAPAGELDWRRPLLGRRALVTGASRGIGAAIAGTLHRDGAELVLLDVPALAEDLAKVAARLEAQTIELDITAEQAPARIADALGEGVDVVVHNAGVTRDRTIAKMPEDRWSSLLEINLSSEERIDDELLARDLLRENGRIVCVSSMSGIAGNSGQTNYATSKAGVIGMVQALAPVLAKRAATINAVAPGFIETQMTAKMPIALREAGRRMNSMSQGGLPIDVAETIAWLSCPASAGVNGNVVRVCGQSLLGA